MARNIFEPLYEILDKLKLDNKSYNLYEKQFSSISEDKIDELRNELQSLRGVLGRKNNEFNKLSLGITTAKDGPVKDRSQQLADDLYKEADELKRRIGKLDEKIKNSDKLKLTKEEFLNLLNTLSEQVRNGNAVRKDQLLRNMLLNLRFNAQNEPVFLWKKPFDKLLEHVEFHTGVPNRNNQRRTHRTTRPAIPKQ
jgi:hypothetical protein